MPVLVWFQRDLRVRDQPALHAACQRKESVVPVFIWAPEEDHPWEPGAASRWWLHHSLQSLKRELKDLGLTLIIRRGPTLKALEQLVKETKAEAVYWNRLYEPYSIKREKEVDRLLKRMGCEGKSFNGSLLFEPGSILTQGGKPYQVFTPFYHACLKEGVSTQPLPAPRKGEPFHARLKGLCVDDLELLPKIRWDKGFEPLWTPGEKGAHAAWKRFDPSTYEKKRDFPAIDGTSHLSPHLHFGEISPLQIWKGLAKPYARQLIWREFAHALLVAFPHTPLRPLNPAFENFPWKKQAKLLHLWEQGKTGFPIVDAGMKQLWKEGWMHNRVRMIVSSFLVKDLLIPWQEGARWFWDTLVDADLANNTLGWQWSAGCGADAAPFFRIFNPTIQAKTFDPKGAYIKAYAPETLAPIVSHEEAREKALRLYTGWRKR